MRPPAAAGAGAARRRGRGPGVHGPAWGRTTPRRWRARRRGCGRRGAGGRCRLRRPGRRAALGHKSRARSPGASAAREFLGEHFLGEVRLPAGQDRQGAGGDPQPRCGRLEALDPHQDEVLLVAALEYHVRFVERGQHLGGAAQEGTVRKGLDSHAEGLSELLQTDPDRPTRQPSAYQCPGRVSPAGSLVVTSPLAAFSWGWVRKKAPVRSAPCSLASRRSAPIRSAQRRSARLRSAAIR